jgi:transcriptional regulator with GAF, ATPase, and Fis domain
MERLNGEWSGPMTSHTIGAEGAETPTEGKDQRLSAIFEIARIMATQQDLETMLAGFLSCIVETLEPPEAGLMLLYDPADECLIVRAAQGYDLAHLRQACLAPGEATCGKTFQSGEAQLYPTPKAVAAGRRNLTPANREIFRAAAIGRRQLQSAICIPLFAGETKVGVLRLENWHQPGSFVREDIPFLEAVADLLALSIENARLREELQTTQALEEANRLKAELITPRPCSWRKPPSALRLSGSSCRSWMMSVTSCKTSSTTCWSHLSLTLVSCGSNPSR